MRRKERRTQEGTVTYLTYYIFMSIAVDEIAPIKDTMYHIRTRNKNDIPDGKKPRLAKKSKHKNTNKQKHTQK